MGFDTDDLRRLIQNPQELRFQELKLLLENYGYTLANSKGSHFRFKKESKPSITIVAHNNKVKKWYVKDVCKLLLSQ